MGKARADAYAGSTVAADRRRVTGKAEKHQLEKRKVVKQKPKELKDDRAPTWLLAAVALLGLIVFVFGTFLLVLMTQRMLK